MTLIKTDSLISSSSSSLLSLHQSSSAPTSGADRNLVGSSVAVLLLVSKMTLLTVSFALGPFSPVDGRRL